MAREVASAFSIRRGDHAHICYRHNSETYLLHTVHLAKALECGEKIAFVVGRDEVDAVAEQLVAAEFPVEELRARGQLTISSTMFDNGSRLDPQLVVDVLGAESRQARDSGHLGLRVCVDGRWGGAESVAVLAVEQRLDTLLHDGGTALAVICHHRNGDSADQPTAAVTAAHRITMSSQQARQREPLLHMAELPDRAGLRVRGEIDETNLADFAAALAELRRSRESIHLDVAELRHASIAAVRLLADTAEALEDGLRITLHSPAPVIVTALRVCGWDRLPALVVKPSANGDQPR
ncbi:MAG: MEDS domain-containing protein [Stackebrandtia sp.]